MKRCSRCGESKSLSHFYKDKKRGYRCNCIKCGREDLLGWRKKNPDKLREQAKRYNIKHSDRISKSHKRYNMKFPERGIARVTIREAIASGKITRPPVCGRCGYGDSTIHGHHDDYTKPLEVQWLCPSCHMKLHAGTL